MLPMGTHMGAHITRKRRLWFLVAVAFALGTLITLAEPDLTVLDKDGDVVSWMPSELLAMLWGDDLEDGEEGGGFPPGETVSDGKEREEFPKEHKEQA